MTVDDRVVHSLDEEADPTGADRAVRINIALVASFALVGLIAALAFNVLSPHLYASSSVVRVYNPYRLSGSQFGQVDPATVTSLELQYAQSASLENAVDAELESKDETYSSVRWTAQLTSATITVECLSASAGDSRDCAEEFVKTYTERRSAAIAKPLDDQVSDITKQLAGLSDRVDALQTKIDQTSGPADTSTDANRGRLAQQQSILSQIAQLTAVKQTTSAQAETVSQNYQVVTQATTPDSLAYPMTWRNLVLGVVAGGLVGLALAALLSRRRQTGRRAPRRAR